MATKAEIEKAREAQRLIKALGYPSHDRLIKAIREGAITGAGVTMDDIRRAEQLFGKSEEYLAGKSAWRKPKMPTEISLEQGIKEDLVGHIDLMFVDKIPFLVSVFKPIDLTIVTFLEDKYKSQKVKALKEQLLILKGFNYNVKFIQSDAGDEFDEIANRCGVTLEPLPPGRKDGVVEAKIRRIKETMRCIIHSLEFPPNKTMIRWAAVFAA